MELVLQISQDRITIRNGNRKKVLRETSNEFPRAELSDDVWADLLLAAIQLCAAGNRIHFVHEKLLNLS